MGGANARIRRLDELLPSLPAEGLGATTTHGPTLGVEDGTPELAALRGRWNGDAAIDGERALGWPERVPRLAAEG
ncbi:MAG TPA: hypothetical protein VK988_21070 [Acidimicrobiales bacterium]|nr:hypothetical protein [Acidimicrobiales bacterium]